MYLRSGILGAYEGFWLYLVFSVDVSFSFLYYSIMQKMCLLNCLILPEGKMQKQSSDLPKNIKPNLSVGNSRRVWRYFTKTESAQMQENR